jgi:hypothetical protein
MKIIYVKWLDHCRYNNSWWKDDEIDELLWVVETVGYIVRETKEALVLSETKYTPTDTRNQTQWSGVMVIAKKLIIERKTLTP